VEANPPPAAALARRGENACNARPDLNEETPYIIIRLER
jgi:hypothetical protein